MSSGPKVRASSNPLRVGDSQYLYTRYRPSVEALYVSEGHHRLKNGAWSGGGPFYVVKDYWEGGVGPTLEFTDQHKPDTATFALYYLPSTQPTLVVPNNWDEEKDTLRGYKATAYRRMRPGNPVASAGQFLIELHQLPTLPLKMLARLKSFRALGSEYLNVVFGWKPFVDDLRKMYALHRTVDSHLAKLVRQNGQNIRRRTVLRDDTTTTSTSSGSPTAFGGLIGGPGFSGSGTSSLIVTRTITTKVWATANMRYFVPDIGSSQWTKRATRALYGVNPTPSLLYEVLPWSWLVDWFSNVGDVVSNASSNAVDNLVYNHSYVMQTTLDKTVYTNSNRWNRLALNLAGQSYDAGSFTTTASHTVETKSRYGGINPFGIDFQLSTITGYQAAILAALGISRQRLL